MRRAIVCLIVMSAGATLAQAPQPAISDAASGSTEYEEGEVRCPHCDSNNVEQSWSAFYAITSKKSA
jgi:cytochrome c-type biogenesis protein CcmH/NrfF